MSLKTMLVPDTVRKVMIYTYLSATVLICMVVVHAYYSWRTENIDLFTYLIAFSSGALLAKTVSAIWSYKTGKIYGDFRIVFRNFYRVLEKNFELTPITDMGESIYLHWSEPEYEDEYVEKLKNLKRSLKSEPCRYCGEKLWLDERGELLPESEIHVEECREGQEENRG